MAMGADMAEGAKACCTGGSSGRMAEQRAFSEIQLSDAIVDMDHID